MSAMTGWKCSHCHAINRGRHIVCFGCGKQRGGTDG